MNRSWITALTLASVVGSGGAFAGVVAATRDTPVSALPPSAALEATLVEPTTPRLAATGTIAYQVGEAGTVTVAVAGDAMSLAGAVAKAGWSTASTTGAGAHLEVQFTDSSQLVTFSADLVGTNVVVSVSNVAVPMASAAEASAPPNHVPVATHSTAPATPSRQPEPTSAATTQPPAYDDGHEQEDEDHADEDRADSETEPNDD